MGHRKAEQVGPEEGSPEGGPLRLEEPGPLSAGGRIPRPLLLVGQPLEGGHLWKGREGGKREGEGGKREGEGGKREGEGGEKERGEGKRGGREREGGGRERRERERERRGRGERGEGKEREKTESRKVQR